MSTAPTLTWEMTATQAVATPASPQSVLDAISAAVTASSDWTVNASASGYLELAPVQASPVNTMRILIATGVNSAQVQAPHNAVAGVIYMGVAPDGGTLGNPLGSTNPYGSARWSGYWKISQDVDSGYAVDVVFATACKEIIGLWLRRDGFTNYYGGLGGCIIDAPTDSDGEGTPGRVFGMLVSGSDGITPSFWLNVNEFVGSNGTSNADPVCGVFKPTDTTTFARVRSIDCGVGETSPRHTTIGGTRVTIPVLMYYRDSPFYLVGPLRQMRKAQDSLMRTKVQDGGNPPADYSIHICQSDSGNPVDCLSLDNG